MRNLILAFGLLWYFSAQADEPPIGYVKNVSDEQGFTSTSSTNPTAVFGDPNPGLMIGGNAYLRQTGTAITRGLIQPRTYGVELQYRF